MKAYMRQLERTRRYLDRIAAIYSGTHPLRTYQHYEDEIASFFIHCYHIRDWLIEHSCPSTRRQDVDKFIDQHDCLRICADYCNGQKHYKLQRKTRTGEQPHLAYQTFSVSHYTPESGIPPTYKATYKIVSQNKVYDVLEIAQGCVDLWAYYIARLDDRM